MVMALDSRLDGLEFDSRLSRLVPGWVTVFEQANHLSISPSHAGQLSLLPSAGRKTSTSQNAVMLCGRGVKAGWLIPFVPFVDKRGWQVKLCDAIPQRFRDDA